MMARGIVDTLSDFDDATDISLPRDQRNAAGARATVGLLLGAAANGASAMAARRGAVAGAEAAAQSESFLMRAARCDDLASGGGGPADFVVGSEGTAVPVSQSRMRAGFDRAGIPSRPATGSAEAGQIHIVDTPHGPVEVRTMEGGAHHPRRVVTSRPGTNDPVRVTGERYPKGTPRAVRRAGAHLEQTP